MTRSSTSAGRVIFLALIAAVLAVVALAGPAFAHSELIERSPAPDTTLRDQPDRVMAKFSEEVGPASTLAVIDLSHGSTVVAQGGLDLNDMERLTLRVDVDLEPGVYRVEWTAESAADGDITEGSWQFSVADSFGVVPAAGQSNGSGSGGLVWALALVVAGAIVVAWLSRRVRSSGKSDSDTGVKVSAMGAVLFILVVGIAGPASAHGRLVSSDPVEGSSSSEAPSELRIWISETVSPRFSSVELTSLGGEVIPIDGLEVTVDGDLGLLTVDLPDLEDGTYSATWTVLSESDGHITRGMVVFGVGTGKVDASAFTVPIEDVPLFEAMSRWLSMLAIMLLVGTVAVARFVLPAHRSHEWRGRVLRWVATASLFGLGAGLLVLIAQAADVSSGLPDGSGFADVATRLATGTLWGRLWLVRQILFAVAAVLAIRGMRRSGTSIHAGYLAVGGGLVVAQALSSHGAGVAGDVALGVTVDAVHLASASVWIGGLAMLVMMRRHLSVVPWRRFGSVAAVAVGLLVATGLFSSALQVASIDAALETAYGRALLTKLGIVVLVGAVALMNAVLVRPDLASPLRWALRRPQGWTPVARSRLSRLVAAEVSLGIVVVGVTALLTSLSPANGVEFTPSSASVDSMSDVVDGVAITLLAQPNLPGDNVFLVHAAPSKRPATEPIERVLLRFTYGGQGFSRTTVRMEEIEPGRFRLGGSQFARPGAWAVDVVVRRRGLPDAVASFDWIVPTGTDTGPIVSDSPLAPTLGFLSVAVLVVLFGGIAWAEWGASGVRSRTRPDDPTTASAPVDTDAEDHERDLEGVNS